MITTGLENKRNGGGTASLGWNAHVSPFFLMALTIFIYMIWLLPGNYREIEPSYIVPVDTPPEKILDYLKGLSKDERNVLIARQRNNFLANPTERTSLFNLGLLYGLEGESEKSNAIALRAANRSFRDVGAQTIAINLSIAKKDYQDAIIRIDGMLRSRPNFSNDYFPLLFGILSDRNGLVATAKLLSSEPPWRNGFMAFATQQLDQKKIVYDVLTELRTMKAEVLPAELRSFIFQLFNVKDYETAYFVWLDFLSPAELSKVNAIYDGGFGLVYRNLEYGWNLYPTKNSEIGTKPKDSIGTDLALNLTFSSLRGDFPRVYQYLRLEPGSYNFKGTKKAELIETPSGIRWRIECVESASRLGESSIVSKNETWNSFEFGFEVPPENCATQKLQLNWASQAVLDRVISGTVWFDDLEIDNAN